MCWLKDFFKEKQEKSLVSWPLPRAVRRGEVKVLALSTRAMHQRKLIPRHAGQVQQRCQVLLQPAHIDHRHGCTVCREGAATLATERSLLRDAPIPAGTHCLAILKHNHAPA